MSKVTFVYDVFPYVKGDVVDLTPEEKARVDLVVKGRNLEGPAYKSGVHEIFETVGSNLDANTQRAGLDRAAAKENLVDQAAQLEAQHTAVAEPANVDALGVVAQTDQVVTGNAPVDGVEVANAQEATDIGSEAGAEVTKVDGKKVSAK